MVPIRGGVEAFYAYASVPGEAFDLGVQVVVVEYHAPRTVYVAHALG